MKKKKQKTTSKNDKKNVVIRTAIKAGAKPADPKAPPPADWYW